MTGLAWTYTTLTNAVQTWLDDTDADWVNSTVLPQLVYLAEKRVTIDLDLTIFDTVSSASSLAASTTTTIVARPTGLIVTDEVGWLNALKWMPCVRRDKAWLHDYLNPANVGPPKYFAEVDATNWMFAPYPDITYTIRSWGPYEPASLNDGSTATWLSTETQELLFLAMIIEVSLLLKNSARLMAAMQEYNVKLDGEKVRLRAYRRTDLQALKGNGLEMPDGKTPGQNPAQE